MGGRTVGVNGRAPSDAWSCFRFCLIRILSSQRVFCAAFLALHFKMTLFKARNPLTHSQMQVTDYLLKRGFHRTEEVFRKESSNLGPDGRPQHKSTDVMGTKKYSKAFILLKKFVESSLDYYKVSLLQSVILGRKTVTN